MKVECVCVWGGGGFVKAFLKQDPSHKKSTVARLVINNDSDLVAQSYLHLEKGMFELLCLFPYKLGRQKYAEFIMHTTKDNN